MIIYCVIVTLISAVFICLYLSTQKALAGARRDFQEKIRSQSNVRIMAKTKNKEMNQLIHEMNELFDELQKIRTHSQKDKETLDLAIHNITHDIRTPLTVASGYTQKLLKNPAGDRETLAKIQRNLKLVSTRLEVLLEYEHLSGENITPHLEPVNLSEILKRELLAFYDSLIAKEIKVTVNLSDDLFIISDPELLQRILQNVFGNVLKHGENEMTIELFKENQSAILIVNNISQKEIQQLDRLATRFYSENMSQTEESSGLGLYITKELIELTDGILILDYSNGLFETKIIWKLDERSSTVPSSETADRITSSQEQS